MILQNGCVLLGVGSLAGRRRVADGTPVISQPDLDPSHTDAILAINTAYKRLCEARSYRARSVETDSSGKSKSELTEFVAPDRHRGVMYVGTDNELETIIIGNRTYSRSKGKWFEPQNPYSKGPAREDLDPFTRCTLENGAPKLPGLFETEVKVIRQEVLGGVPVLTYRSTTDFNGTGGPDSFVVTHSIGTKDGLIYRREIVTSKDESLKTTGITVFSDYNADIRIEAPI